MFRRVLRVAVPLAAAGALTAVAGLSQAATTPGWRIVATLPNNSVVTALTATGAGDAWAAGTACANASCTRDTLLVRRWNGKAWTVISVPKAYVNSTAQPGASAIAATSAANAWIFDSGTAVPGAAQPRAILRAIQGKTIPHAAQPAPQTGPTAVLHWTGKGWGATVKLPADITAAVAPAAKDAWAFGGASTSASPFGAAYAAHYNGTKWSPVRVPVMGIGASATSASNIWVVGLPTTTKALSGQLVDIMDFNGKGWHTTPVPSLGLKAKQAAVPMGVAAVSAKNVWAVGQIIDTSSTNNPFVKPFLLHWNGKKWAVIKVPYNAIIDGSIAQDGHGGVWMSAILPTTPAVAIGYMLHYANGSWSKTAAPARRGEILIPAGLAWIPGTRSVWGAGMEIPTGPTGAPPSVIFKYGA